MFLIYYINFWYFSLSCKPKFISCRCGDSFQIIFSKNFESHNLKSSSNSSYRSEIITFELFMTCLGSSNLANYFFLLKASVMMILYRRKRHKFLKSSWDGHMLQFYLYCVLTSYVRNVRLRHSSTFNNIQRKQYKHKFS